MRVSFKYSQDDLVDATVRFATRSKAIRDIRRRNLFWTVVLLVLVVILMLKISIVMAVGAALTAILMVIVYPYMFDRRYRENLRKIYKERLGDENEFICEVELLPESMKTSGQDCEATIEWSTVEAIVSTDDSVDIFGRKGGCVVRNRAFVSPEERQTFIDLAQKYMNSARSSTQK